MAPQLRTLLATSLVSLNYLDTLNTDLKLKLIDNTNNIALMTVVAIQTAVIASSVAAAAATSSASSS